MQGMRGDTCGARMKQRRRQKPGALTVGPHSPTAGWRQFPFRRIRRIVPATLSHGVVPGRAVPLADHPRSERRDVCESLCSREVG